LLADGVSGEEEREGFRGVRVFLLGWACAGVGGLGVVLVGGA